MVENSEELATNTLTTSAHISTEKPLLHFSELRTGNDPEAQARKRSVTNRTHEEEGKARVYNSNNEERYQANREKPKSKKVSGHRIRGEAVLIKAAYIFLVVERFPRLHITNKSGGITWTSKLCDFSNKITTVILEPAVQQNRKANSKMRPPLTGLIFRCFFVWRFSNMVSLTTVITFNFFIVSLTYLSWASLSTVSISMVLD
ncbi:hypothetical protein GQX74_013095 [Glossina fuscipes]|nr:hypothetical protein GQX74_013095 [Glossina fuscipes]